MKVPKKSGDASKFPRLPEMNPLVVEIVVPGPADKPNPEYIDGEYKGEPRKSVRFRMRVVEGPYAGNPANPEEEPPGMVWGTHGFTVEKRKNGESSMLRQLVQAASDHELSEEELHDVDLDSLRGRRLIVLGRYPEDDEEKVYLKPLGYSRVAPAQAGNRVTAPAPAAPAVNGNDGYQFTPDGLHRWKEGMAAWEPVPAAAPPPPPPAPVAAAPVPPPPPAAPAAPPAPPAAPPAPPVPASAVDF